MRCVISAGIAIVAFSATIVAQPPPALKPGAEQKRIGFFAGTWTFAGEAKASPMGPGGKLSGTETCEWYTGGFHLVCKTKMTGPRGTHTGQSIMGYDPARKMYTYHAISSGGDGIFARGTVDGKVWTWTDESTMEGKAVKIRATITEESPTSTSFKLEASFDGGPMTVIEEGKSTKAKT